MILMVIVLILLIAGMFMDSVTVMFISLTIFLPVMRELGWDPIAYGTSKAAVIHLTKQQAAELGEIGIRANCVCPGPVDTKQALAVHSPEIRAAYHDAMPLNRYGTEREIAEAICFLASERAGFITGQVLAADGGFDATGVGLPALRV